MSILPRFDPPSASPGPSGDSDVLIVGAGLAGSLLALMLGRAGHAVTVFDPRRDPSASFRLEKLSGAQIVQLEAMGLLSWAQAACWSGLDHPRPPLVDCGAPHARWIAAARAAWPDGVRFVEATVEDVEVGDGRSWVSTRCGGRWGGRLVVLATGRSEHLLERLGVVRRTLHAGHSVCLGFSVAPEPARAAEVLEAPPGRGIGYATLFPAPGETRVNVFSYRALQDPWTRRMAADPLGALAEVHPEAAARLAGAQLLGRCDVRGSDLYAVSGHRRSGVLIIGDAFHAPSPATGTGLSRILNDIEILSGTWLPRWLATPGMGAGKIACFYDDPRKLQFDAESLRRSVNGRGAIVGVGPYWMSRRWLGRIRRGLERSAPEVLRALAATPGSARPAAREVLPLQLRVERDRRI